MQKAVVDTRATKTSGKDQKSKKKGRKQQQKQIKPWKKEPPKEGEPRTKVVNNKTYNWCPKHLAWTFHTKDECRLKLQAENASKDDKSNAKGGKKGGKKQKWLKTLAAICDDFSDNEDDDEEDSSEEEENSVNSH
jgi:hypothetical protein